MNYIIKQEGDEWVLYDHTGKKVLGRHKSKEKAEAQEKAIQSRKGAFEALGITHDDVMLAYAFENDLHTIKDVEIFAAGTWRGVNSPPEGDKYTKADLESMVEAFNSDVMAPNLKITHGADKEQLDIGRVSNLRVTGSKLIADFVDMPKALYELMKKGLFKSRSAEVIWDLKDKAGKTWNRVLKAVALLAPGQTPAVGALADGYKFEALYCYEVGKVPEITEIVRGWRSWAKNYYQLVALAIDENLCAWIYSQTEGKWPIGHQAPQDYEPTSDDLTSVEMIATGITRYQEIQIKQEEARQKMALEDLLKKYGAKDEAELDKILANKELAENKLREYEAQRAEDRKTKVYDFIEQAKKDGKILPKEEEGIKKSFESLLDKEDEAGIESLKTFIGGLDARVDLGEHSKDGGKAKGYDAEKAPADEVDRLATAYVAEGKAKDYKTALDLVSQNHEELWTAYLKK